MAWYNFDEKKEFIDDSKIIKDNVRFDKFILKNKITVNELSDICFNLPGKGEQIRIITQKRFNAFSLISWLISNLPNVDEILLTSYRIDENTLKGIKEILETRNINKLIIVLSAFFTSTKIKEPFAEQLKDLAISNKKVKAIFCHNHTKIMAVKSKVGSFVIEGSGNLTGNARIEQYSVIESEDVYNFHREWIFSLKETPKKVMIYGN